MKYLKNKILSNTSWLISEKLVSVFGLIFITSYVAKYIGPADFGRLNFAIYIFSIVQTIAMWGTDTICTKRISRNKNSGVKVLFSVYKIRVFIFLLSAVFVNFYFYFSASMLSFIFSLSITLSTFFIIQDVYLIYNDSTLNSKINVVTNIVGVCFGFFIRYIIVLFELPVWMLSISIVAVSIIPFFLRKYIFFTKQSSGRIVLSKREEKKYLGYIFYTGVPLVFSSISVAIYINASRLILGYMEAPSTLGIYSVSIVLGSAWGFVNSSFIRSVTPKLYSSSTLKEASFIVSIICYILIIVGLLYFFLFYFFGGYAVGLLYGVKYESSITSAFPLLLSTCTSALGMVCSLYIVYQGGYSYLGKKNIVTCIFGCFISYFLILKFGILGAAYSTLLIEFLSLTVFNYFFNNGVVLKLHLNIINPINVFILLRRWPNRNKVI